MDRVIVLALIGAIIAVGLGAGAAALATPHDAWSPRAYVPAKPGDCWVPPQGDPLYDQHYAQQVNPQNCQALEDQSNAKYTDAQTRAVDWQTNQSRAGVYSLLGVVVAVLVLLSLAIRR